MTLQAVFGLLVVLYTVANLASIGLELNLHETIKSLRRAREIAKPMLILVLLPLVVGVITQSRRAYTASLLQPWFKKGTGLDTVNHKRVNYGY